MQLVSNSAVQFQYVVDAIFSEQLLWSLIDRTSGNSMRSSGVGRSLIASRLSESDEALLVGGATLKWA